MMIDLSTEMPKVIGNNRLIAAVDPNPGSTPTSVPTNTPMRQTKRFTGSKAIRKHIKR